MYFIHLIKNKITNFTLKLIKMLIGNVIKNAMKDKIMSKYPQQSKPSSTFSLFLFILIVNYIINNLLFQIKANW